MESKKHTEKKKMRMSEYIKGKEIRINVEKRRESRKKETIPRGLAKTV